MLFHRLRQKRRGGGLVVAAWVSHVTWIMPKCCFHFWVLFCLLQDCHSFQMKKDTFSWYSGVLNFQTNLKDVISKNPVPSQTNYWACCLTFWCSLNFLKIREIAIRCLHWPLNNSMAHRTGMGIWFLRIMRFSFLFEVRGGRGDVRRAKTVGSLLLPYRTPLILGKPNISLGNL